MPLIAAQLQGRVRHTAFALTKVDTSDPGRFTRQFFKGVRAISADEAAFLFTGAIVGLS